MQYGTMIAPASQPAAVGIFKLSKLLYFGSVSFTRKCAAARFGRGGLLMAHWAMTGLPSTWLESTEALAMEVSFSQLNAREYKCARGRRGLSGDARACTAGTRARNARGADTARRVMPLLTKRNAPRDGRPIQAE
jgi:hypothetical protein